MRSNIYIGNESKPIEAIIFENLLQAKGVVVSISNELEFHQKQTLNYAIQAGECLYKIQELCLINNKKFNEFLIDCNIKWSYVQFLIPLYNFSKGYPKICKISLSLYFIKNNFKKIKLAI
jgi:hypothetical protein